jgi:hypothetical protein
MGGSVHTSEDVPETGPGDAPPTPGTVGTTRRERAWVTAIPVLLVLLTVAVLTGANLNGSSVHELATAKDDPDLILGTSQRIRADEWVLSTPNLVGNARRGMPARTWIGLTPTFLPATSIGVPSAHWTEVFKPYDWGLFILPVDRGFAWRWWGLLALGLLGVYPLLWQLSRSMITAGALSVVAVLAPVTAWWSLTPAAVLGTLAGAGACLVAAARSRNLMTTALWGAGAGYLGVAGFLILYPPWILPVGLVVAAVVVGRWLDLRARPHRIAVAAAGAAAVAVPALSLWYLQSYRSIRATAGTNYPGSRISRAGEASLSWLLDAPSSLWLTMASPRSILRTSSGSAGGRSLWQNPSEIASSWLPLPVMAAVVIVLVWTGYRMYLSRTLPDTGDAPAPGRVGDLPFWTVLVTVLMTAVLLAWALLPVPDPVGRLTLLDRVPGRRLPSALGLAAAVIMLGGGMLLRGRHAPRWVAVMPWLGGLGTVAATVWAVRALDWKSHAPTVPAVTAVAVVFALGAAAVASGRVMRTGAVVLAALAVITFATVNPVYRGLGPLENDPVVLALREDRERDGPVRVAVYGGLELNALAVASGASVLSGLTVYPDAGVWSRLAPDQKPLWNNFAKYLWEADTTAGGVRIVSAAGTNKSLLVDPCSPAAHSLHIDMVLSREQIDAECLVADRTVPHPDGPVYLYRSTW